MNRWMAVSMVLAGLVVGMLLGGGQARLAWADDAASPAATQKCEWSYLQDSGMPDLGREGKVEMGDDWKAMNAEGWRLVMMNGVLYYFERCR
jgi:hypothetical protein